MSAPIVAVDTETTGLHHDRRPWEIALIRRDDYGERALVLQVIDVDLTTAEPKALAVGRFYERHTRHAEPIRQLHADGELSVEYAAVWEGRAATLVEEWTRGAHIVGVNPTFDVVTLAAMFRRHRLAPSWHYHLLDVPAMALGWLHARSQQFAPGPVPEIPYRSYQLSEQCDVEPPADDVKHTALGDAEWSLRWFDRITAGR